MYDSTLDAAGRGFGTWSPEMRMVPEPTLLTEGVYVAFLSSSGYTAGDIYYVPAKVTRLHRLSHGANVAFGAESGYSPFDRWTFTATAGEPARGPLSGDTELIVTGSDFLPSSSLLCRITDERTAVTKIVPARFVNANRVTCATPEHPPDTVSDPSFAGSGSSALSTYGVFTGAQSVEFTVRMTSATHFEWRADPEGETTGVWRAAAPIVTDAIQPLERGVGVRWSEGETYSVGDRWRFTAYSADAARRGDRLEIQLGGIRPGVMKYVAVSNDGGISWSADRHGATRFLYSDVYVSSSGDDVAGDGTASAPYRTIQRGIHAALSPASAHTPEATNRDEIIVAPGRYTGAGNTGLFTMGKSVVVKAARPGEAVIDCATRVSGVAHFGETARSAEGSGKVRLVGVNVENCGL
jgi:hypothetical protein